MDLDAVVDILLVEDNPNDAELTIHSLKKHNLANHLYWVKDGAEALDFLFYHGAFVERSKNLPRVVLLDLRLPKVDGIEVLREIRKNENTKNLPVVVLTSSKEERDLVDTYNLGVNSYVAKPVSFQDFSETVAELGMYWMLVNRIPSEVAAPK